MERSKHYGYIKAPCAEPYSVKRAITLVQAELVANPGILGRTLHASVEESILLQHPTTHLAHIRRVADLLRGDPSPSVGSARTRIGAAGCWAWDGVSTESPAG